MEDSSESSSMSCNLVDLIDIAFKYNWCTKPYCTTCGAKEFRHALKMIPREYVIEGLRSLSSEFLSNHTDTFRLIILEISLFGSGGELLDDLNGTPAEELLRYNIDYQNSERERRNLLNASQTPEAIFEGRIQRKVERLKLTAPHRERKAATVSAVKNISSEIAEIPSDHLLSFIASRSFSVPLKVVGGLVYKRLCKYYKSIPIGNEDLVFLSYLAENHSGYWKKLLDNIS